MILLGPLIMKTVSPLDPHSLMARRNPDLIVEKWCKHYTDVIMGAIASQITSLTIVYPTVFFRRRSKKTSKLRVTGLCERSSPVTVNSPHKWPVTRKMFPFDDVIMYVYKVLRILKGILKSWLRLIEIGECSAVAPSQWEAALVCNDATHWLGASLESVLGMDEYTHL